MDFKEYSSRPMRNFMQLLNTYSWHSMTAFMCAHAMETNMMRGIEMEIKQVKLIT